MHSFQNQDKGWFALTYLNLYIFGGGGGIPAIGSIFKRWEDKIQINTLTHSISRRDGRNTVILRNSIKLYIIPRVPSEIMWPLWLSQHEPNICFRWGENFASLKYRQCEDFCCSFMRFRSQAPFHGYAKASLKTVNFWADCIFNTGGL